MLIYLITNRITGKQYVGQTINTIQRRWREYCYEAKRGCRFALHLAIQKYGKENFTVEQIDVACDRDELDRKEQFWMEYYNTLTPNGYNLQTGGGHHTVSEETRKRMSEAAGRGENHHWYGRHHTDEVKERIRQAHLGRKFTKEHCENMGKVRKGEKNWNYGRKWSDDVKKKMSEARIGRFRGANAHHARPVMCIETGEVFGAVKVAAQAYGGDDSSLGKVCKGKQKTWKGLHWKYVDEVTVC